MLINDDNKEYDNMQEEEVQPIEINELLKEIEMFEQSRLWGNMVEKLGEKYQELFSISANEKDPVQKSFKVEEMKGLYFAINLLNTLKEELSYGKQ